MTLFVHIEKLHGTQLKTETAGEREQEKCSSLCELKKEKLIKSIHKISVNK